MPKRIAKRVRDEIKKLADEGLDGVQIAKHLWGLYGEGEIDSVPHLRTIQNIVQEYVSTDSSDRWQLADANADTVALVAWVLGHVASFTKGRRLYLTTREAEFAAKIRLAAPLLRGFTVFQLAREYIRLEKLKKSTEDLDLAVGLAASGKSVAAFKVVTGRDLPQAMFAEQEEYPPEGD